MDKLTFAAQLAYINHIEVLRNRAEQIRPTTTISTQERVRAVKVMPLSKLFAAPIKSRTDKVVRIRRFA